MKKVHVFTSAAFNYIPKVRMLFQSLRKYHPEWVLHLALADELRAEIDLSREPFDDVLTIDTLDIPNWRGWAFCHTIVELATAIKPFALIKLLQRPDCEKVIYMDPDMVAFSRLDDILAALDESNLVLTPHLTKPEATLDAVMDNEICSLKHGVYNLGFIGVAANEEGRRFADWWAKRLYYFCRADIKNGLFTDQRWIDLVPAFFDGVAIMRSGRHNVASWNLTTRQLTGDVEGGLFVDGESLGFYHFTGFDSGAHRIMATKNAGVNRSVQALVNWYDKLTKDIGKDPLARAPWAFAVFSNGERISPAQRLVYRERMDLQAAFPDPFDAFGFLKWWNGQGKVEYPALFNPETEKAEFERISSPLTPGYRAGVQEIRWGSIINLIGSAIDNPQTARNIVRRGWNVLKREGWPGISRRLKG